MHAETADLFRISSIRFPVFFRLLVHSVLVIAVCAVNRIALCQFIHEGERRMHVRLLRPHDHISAHKNGFRILISYLLKQSFVPPAVAHIVQIT